MELVFSFDSLYYEASAKKCLNIDLAFDEAEKIAVERNHLISKTKYLDNSFLNMILQDAANPLNI